MDAEDYAGAARRLAGALCLWNGPALSGVQAGSQIEMETRRLEEARLCALAQRIDADLHLGRHRELLPELTVLVSRHRMHESLHGQFMVALHRAGRRGEALDVYQRLRATLVTELGLEPSAPLGRLQRSILTARPDHTPCPPPPPAPPDPAGRYGGPGRGLRSPLPVWPACWLFLCRLAGAVGGASLSAGGALAAVARGCPRSRTSGPWSNRLFRGFTVCTVLIVTPCSRSVRLSLLFRRKVPRWAVPWWTQSGVRRCRTSRNFAPVRQGPRKCGCCSCVTRTARP